MLYVSPVSKVYGIRNPKKGDLFGIEIEVECSSPIEEGFPNLKDFSVKADGSLRNVGYEFVSVPFNGDVIKDDLEWIKKITGGRLIESARSSTHIHMNVSDILYFNVWNILTTWYIFEPLVMHYCGKYRKGNPFARTLSYSNSLKNSLVSTLTEDKKLPNANDMRYQAANFVSLGRFGTLEFRPFPSTLEMSTLKIYMDLLQNIKDYAISKSNPTQVLDDFMSMSNRDFTRRVIGDTLPYYDLVESDMNMSAEIIGSIVDQHPDSWDYTKDPRLDKSLVGYGRDLLDAKRSTVLKYIADQVVVPGGLQNAVLFDDFMEELDGEGIVDFEEPPQEALQPMFVVPDGAFNRRAPMENVELFEIVQGIVRNNRG